MCSTIIHYNFVRYITLNTLLFLFRLCDSFSGPISKIKLDCITASPDGSFFMVADKNSGKVSAHNLATGHLSTLEATGMKPGFITTFGGHLAVSEHDAGRVCVFDIESANKITEFPAPCARGVAFHPDTRSIVVACSEDVFGSGFLRQYCMGMLVGKLAESLYFPQGMGFISHDKLGVADKTTAKIFKLTRY